MRRRRFGYSLCLGFMIFGLLAAVGDGSESTQSVDVIPSSVILNEDALGVGLEKDLDESSSSNSDVSGSGLISTQLPAVVSRKQDNFALERFRDRPAARSLLTTLSPEVNAQLIAALDGKVQLVDRNSGKAFWSFSSGPAIYSSYQAPASNDSDVENALATGEDHYLECGENWELLIRQKTGTTVFPGGIDKYFREMPHITYDGVTVGSKKTTVFVLDAMSGKLINTYQSSTLLNTEDKSIIEDLEASRPMKESDDVLPLYITRTDYLLQRFPPNSKKVLWNMTVAEIEAAIICRDLKNPSGDNPLIQAYVGNSESESTFVMPLPCHTKTMVVRPPLVYSTRESSGSNKRLLKGPEKLMLPVDVPNHKLRPVLPVENVLNFDHERSMLSLPASVNVPPLKTKHDKALDYFYNHNDNNIAITGQFSELKNPGVSGPDVLGMLSGIIGVALFVVLFIRKIFKGRREAELEKQSTSVDIKSGSAKKKRVRKSGKNNSTPEKRDESSSPEFEDRSTAVSSENKQLIDLNKLAGAGVGGRRIGKLFISSKEIAKGSNGTIVLEGIHDGRPAAVKRLVQTHHDFAVKEIQNLIVSDRHPNIVRWYGVEHDQDFVYLSLERCSCSLDDLIQVSQFSSQYGLLAQQQASQAAIEYSVRLNSMKGLIEGINLWKPNGYPSLVLLQLMRDVVSGLVHLHELGIVHRDLKPQNVLITKERSLCAKLSDMGISKRLRGDMSSLDLHATGCGSSGWQAPEQLNNGRQTRSVDLFSLGCVLFFCITGGRHPFGDRLERDINIVKNKMDLFLVEQIPEAVDLLSQLLSPDPEMRPKAFAVLHHPLFWSSETRLSFLRDASDRVELEDREADSDILKALESKGPVALGSKWDEKMEPAFINNIGRYRRYKYDSVRDLLRVMRNKLNHYRELPQEIKELLGPVPEGFDGYFASRFPELLIEVYKVIHRYCGEEECFQKYFKGLIM